ncbi:MAG: Holliday junction resolvase RuvX [Candidatus Omnitrophica bacterium]|nr:Holliday junction resolvase RuvX [Candidatus Omnitrophota bacterium]MCM8793346.1 Holliday junction resolvase RuvX [Candidatus Omnitrophota bacterium]
MKEERILGIDFGEKRIGLAITDALGIIAQGLDTWENNNDLFVHLEELIKKYGIKKIVVGIPRDRTGKIKRISPVSDFVERLKERINLPLEIWDEHLTTSEAEKILVKAEVSRKKRKKVIDKLSAQIILQGYLDYNSNIKNQISK